MEWFRGEKSGEEEPGFYLEAFKGQEEEEQRMQCLWENSEPYLFCGVRAHECHLSGRSNL